MQRLSTETDRLKGDKELLEQKIHDISVNALAGDVRTDEEVVQLQHRLKVRPSVDALTGDVTTDQEIVQL